MSASEVLSLAGRAAVGPGTRVLDLCCGEAGPGLFVTRSLGCTYRGVDASARAIARARRQAAREGIEARLDVGTIPPVPPGPFDVVLLLETMLAFRDKRALLRGIASALATGGRFACTVEEGLPLTEAERHLMPAAETVWLTPLPAFLADVESAGLRVRWYGDCTSAHHARVDSLVGTYAAAGPLVGRGEGTSAVDGLLTSHRLWSCWLRDRRVRKFAVVAEKA
ncbi:class I SAM-dependent methyltransferase [Fodinibacter luteus]|uniref:class I SAM-dependent methyltransferase n=1 Tax=Fodinibacter luteus TaxID=552064 RepID=UPI0031F16039